MTFLGHFEAEQSTRNSEVLSWRSLHNARAHICDFTVSLVCFHVRLDYLVVLSTHYLDPTRLSTQSRVVDLEQLGIYNIVLQFCLQLWPNAGIFGPGMVQNHYLAPMGMVRNHSYVEYNGIRYGAYQHTSGRGYCYAYIDGRNAVRIERILHIEFPVVVNMRAICALVSPFQIPQVEPHFPWDTWYAFYYHWC